MYFHTCMDFDFCGVCAHVCVCVCECVREGRHMSSSHVSWWRCLLYDSMRGPDLQDNG